MKTAKLFTLLFIAVTCLACNMSCNKKSSDPVGGTSNTGDNKIPDVVFKGQVKRNGSVVHDISFTLPKGTAGQYAMNGSYSGVIDMFQVMCQEQGKWALSISGKTGGVKTGEYNVSESASYYNTSLQIQGFLAESGTFKITKADLYAQAGNIKTWFINGEVNMTLKDAQNDVLTVTGTFSGISITAN